ncbi:Rieske (2Fe-2S) protein [Streptomyces yaizuensis]|uniref:Rieske 2Fe-2S domain-containing protein n=1 Tax=Streptomyces yaizuensis TaxID=2989713 RepID=A0ABQ5P595_9ACTN|nr:Rieske 2Fe-2S domain-containing protein [Streptomyces sp. YSPA8]GLF97755.1 Rieske 2Fe-2S domain-containing protein [Streptomyces sp. YSPA8]
MLVVTLAAEGRGNCVTVDDTPYIYAHTARGGFLMRARCPHRGGPLHLAELTPEGRRLVCPWHERKTSMAAMSANLPAVRSGSTVTAVVPHDPGATVVVSHVPLSADLARDCAAPGLGKEAA